MGYDNFDSELICSWCDKPFTTKNVRMKRQLCPDCRNHEGTIRRYADGRSYSKVPLEVKMMAYKDQTVRYGQRSSESKLRSYQMNERKGQNKNNE